MGRVPHFREWTPDQRARHVGRIMRDWCSPRRFGRKMPCCCRYERVQTRELGQIRNLAGRRPMYAAVAMTAAVE